MSDNINSLQFRMYHTGSVGDCLLLLFRKKEVISFKMLIDCGGWNADKASINACAADILQVTGGEIDLLVVTHQHEDHVSGFNQARAVFDQLKVKEVWMSWVEDANDEIAKILKEKYGKKLKELRKATELALAQIRQQEKTKLNVKRYGQRLGMSKTIMTDTLNLISFEEGKMAASKLVTGKRTNDDAMKYVKSKSKKMQFRLPGEVITDRKGAEGLKFYILGPPRDADMRFFKDPENPEELYKLSATAEIPEAEPSTGNPILRSGINLEEDISPFEKRFHLNGAEKSDFLKLYNSADYRWRQIENDWLETAASIAMRATNLTNNTSLAMAIELGTSGKVLLLPADAQSGNWMGWHKPDVKRKLKAKGGKDTRELLENTVLYKVGHHGSHNGTASKSGLDLMNHKQLVAMMPLVQSKVPKEWGGANNFPAKALYEVLIGKTKGRVIRTDEGIINDPKAVSKRKEMSAVDRKAFEKAVKTGKNYLEFTLDFS